ncbi:choice-of-anchor M domain-containing protein [Luteolibacter yonseiensis]|uniref:Choice-of-anchor M domain-containing protein n=1 Tax=Luteolibacter yonseiensis TaxID=1144680 RepID=A0A934V9D8_9BACT|nr:choice-of-anchor M domain-containing protein [Luteolibacter yonseiensis]MBK1815033.1 choice-of-anchor M domain-containing protein [Luteolibacter yonseiensis]
MRTFSTCFIILAIHQQAMALFPLQDHIDLRVAYRSSMQDWQWSLMTEGENVDPSLAYFPARDAEYPDGERDYRPPGNEWNFLGVREGGPLWIYPESSSAHSWLGFDNTASGLMDPVRFKLVKVLGPSGGHFALYRVISGMPVVFMSTHDGISEGDVFSKPAGHHHLNWSFSRAGMWAVDLKVSASQSGGRGPAVAGPTDTTRLFFAIGKQAEWRARNFAAAHVMDESIAGANADPDHDGWSNLLEYAFGGNPLMTGLHRANSRTSAAPVHGVVQHLGKPHATITFFRHRDPQAAGIGYAVQWQAGLADSGWTEGGVVHQTQAVDATWERVTIRDPAELTADPGFVRIRINTLR